ncbi:MAG: hypothetical protein RIQ81_20 [Pseudomonadota bacterium]
MEASESAPDAATRECLEETGHQVRIDPESNLRKSYLFHWAGLDVPCVTEFFRAYLARPFAAPAKISDDPELNLGLEWVPLSKVTEVLGFHREILDGVECILSQPPKRVLCAFSAFKGTLSARDACDAAVQAIQSAGHVASSLPIADGGRGSMDFWQAIAAKSGAQLTLLDIRVQDPIGREVSARVAMRRSKAEATLFIESADCLGMHLVGAPEPATAMIANSYGFGMLLRDLACRFPAGTRCVVGLGDSAVSDCGAGMLQALGFGLRLKSGEVLDASQFNTGLLRDIAAIVPPPAGSPEFRDLKALRRFQWTVLCDVLNPLCGPKGAMRVFSPQKGALPEQVNLLAAGARNVAKLFANSGANRDWAKLESGGASGGVAAAMAWALRARLKPGARWFLDVMKFRTFLKDQDIFFTGEGSSDAQSPAGKAPFVFLSAAQAKGLTTCLVSGRVQLSAWPRKMRGELAIARACGLEPDARTALCHATYASLVEIITGQASGE